MEKVKTHQSTVVGVFKDRTQASNAVEDLHRAGFTDKQIGFVSLKTDKNPPPTIVNEIKTSPSAPLLGGLGGLLGDVLAAVEVLLVGIGPVIAGGTLASLLGDGLLGALTGLGVSEKEAHHYQKELETGSTIVTVAAGERSEEVLSILRRHGASDAITVQS